MKDNSRGCLARIAMSLRQGAIHKWYFQAGSGGHVRQARHVSEPPHHPLPHRVPRRGRLQPRLQPQVGTFLRNY